MEPSNCEINNYQTIGKARTCRIMCVCAEKGMSMIMMIFLFRTNLVTTAEETLREIIDVVLHTSEIGIEEIRDHENSMLASRRIMVHLILILKLNLIRILLLILLLKLIWILILVLRKKV